MVLLTKLLNNITTKKACSAKNSCDNPTAEINTHMSKLDQPKSKEIIC